MATPETHELVVDERELPKVLLPQLVGRVFHVTSGSAYQEIQRLGRVETNQAGEREFTFAFSGVSYFRRRGCVSVCDLRFLNAEAREEARLKYNFVRPTLAWQVIVFLFLGPEARQRVITWDDAVREDGLTIQGVPHLEGGHPGPIPIGDLEQVLQVQVRMDPAMEQFRRMFSAPGRLEQKQ